MFDGSGVYEILRAEERKRLLPVLIQRFEAHGVEFTTGFLAGLQGRKPLWLLKLMRTLRISQGPFCTEEAAQEALRRHGINPLTCGRTFFAK